MRALLILAALAALIYLAICVALFVFQRSMLYYPQLRAVRDGGTTLELAVGEERLVVTVRPREGPKALLYFGGNAEDTSFNLPSFAESFPDHALYLMHYRGYGGSTGAPSEAALQRDALALFDHVRGTHPEIAVVGRSLGSGVAIRLASVRPASHLVLVTPFDSMEAMAAAQFPYLPASWLLRDKYRSWRHASAIRVPTLLLAAERDEIVPAASTARLLAAFAPGVAKLEVLAGTGHNGLSGHPRYLEAVRAALER
jgi:uncharacterized protein